MPNPIYRYPLDTTGINPDNKVVGEIHTLQSALEVRILAPIYGAFFTESLILYDNTTNQQLIRGVHYQPLELLQEASLRYGQEICLLIGITDSNISSTISIENIQYLGGYYQNNAQNLISMYEAVINDNRPVDWLNIFNKPLTYPPSLHTHLFTDVQGFQYLNDQLERLRDAIILNNVPQFEALIEWVINYIQRATDNDVKFCRNQDRLISLGQVLELLRRSGINPSCPITFEELGTMEECCSTNTECDTIKFTRFD